MARTALSTAKFVAGLVNAEKKFIDTNITLNMQNTGWTVTPLNLIGQGDDETQRQGRSVKCTSIQFSYLLTVNSATQGHVSRFVLVRDNACAGSAMSVSDLFNSTSGDFAVSTYRNILTGAATRYTVVADWTVRLDVGDRHKVAQKKFWKINDHIHYIGTGNTQADCGNGCYFLLTIGTGVNASNTDAQLNATARLRYYDN